MNHPQSILRRRLAVSAVALAVLALAVPVAAVAQPGFAGPMGPGGPMHGEHHAPGGAPMMPFLHRLNLSEAQQDKVFAIRHALAPQMREQAKIAHKARVELQEMSLSDRFEEAKARALADSSARAHAEMALLRAKSMQQIFAQLTPEQRKQAVELRSARQQMRPGMRPGDDGPHGPSGPRMEQGPGSPAERWNPPVPRGE